MPSLRPQGSSSTAAASGLRLMSVALGVFFLFNGLGKLAWFTDSSILAERLQEWRQGAAPSTQWYIDTVAGSAVPLFARVVPLAEMTAGAALIAGFWTRMAAALALLMVANFHFARGFFYEYDFLVDGAGLPVIGALLALAVGGSRLPFSATK